MQQRNVIKVSITLNYDVNWKTMAISYDLRPVGLCSSRETNNVTVKEDSKLSLIGLSQDEMVQALKAIGIPEHQTRMRVRQLWHWLYVRGISNFDEMRNISKSMQEMLKSHFLLRVQKLLANKYQKMAHVNGFCVFQRVEQEDLWKLKRFISLKKGVGLYVFHLR